MPPKSAESFRRTDAEDIFNYVIRDRLDIVEKTPMHKLEAASLRRLSEAEAELKRLLHASRGFGPLEAATLQSLFVRIERQKIRCDAQQQTAELIA